MGNQEGKELVLCLIGVGIRCSLLRGGGEETAACEELGWLGYGERGNGFLKVGGWYNNREVVELSGWKGKVFWNEDC